MMKVLDSQDHSNHSNLIKDHPEIGTVTTNILFSPQIDRCHGRLPQHSCCPLHKNITQKHSGMNVTPAFPDDTD